MVASTSARSGLPAYHDDDLDRVEAPDRAEPLAPVRGLSRNDQETTAQR
jgi:hypothetical protein